MERIAAMIERLPYESLGMPVSSRPLRELYSRTIEKTAREHVLPMAGARRYESLREEMTKPRAVPLRPGHAT